ncbi:7732_t:CDS:2 [Paraglomus brasilianum]|uniref:7732_t:CDS:1 n=1 Tax=Paraglomus brasilianum TaxID=144538 RepID=A0A9N8WMK4_9GLOM|nr:7732_t:CDS:2 [Paraglomus brasilianum]
MDNSTTPSRTTATSSPSTVNTPTILSDMQIYKATYSGVGVWEFRCKDGWLNATQILKVAEFDKPHRTRILEREVQKGDHEKVQGGYGKYQGTWVPYQIGVELAGKYGVKEVLRPIIDFVPTADSPPLAPKHVTAASNKPRKPREPKDTKPIKPRVTKKSLKKERLESPRVEPVEETDADTNEIISAASPQSTHTSEVSSLSHTPAQLDSANDSTESDVGSSIQRARRKRRNGNDHNGRAHKLSRTSLSQSLARQYGEAMLRYFTTNAAQIPDFIINPPVDFDPNVVIDQQDHTALHWSAAMANVEMARLLIQAGARIDAQNMHGETALMRSVMFPYNQENHVFDQLLDLLHPTIGLTDHNRQNVLHHIAIAAGARGRVGPSKYYMELVLRRLAEHSDERIRLFVINCKNSLGDTTLVIAAKHANKKLVRLLMDHGADPTIRNKEGKNVEDYILELDAEARIRASSLPSPSPCQHPYNNCDTIPPPASSSALNGLRGTRENLLPSATQIMQEFQSSYDERLRSLDDELGKMQQKLAQCQKEMEAGKQVAEDINKKAQEINGMKKKVAELEWFVKEEIKKNRGLRLDEMISEEMEKEDKAVVFNGGKLDMVDKLRKELQEIQETRNQAISTLSEKIIHRDDKLIRYKLLLRLASSLSPEFSSLEKSLDALVLTTLSAAE